MEQKSIGLRYIDCITHFEKESAHKLFSSDARKIVNSRVICINRDQLISQMEQVHKTFGVSSVKLLELIEAIDPKINVIQFEITFKDDTTESVITIIKCTDSGLIQEINEVFGEKDGYQPTI